MGNIICRKKKKTNCNSPDSKRTSPKVLDAAANLAEIQQNDETPRRLSLVLKPAPRLSTRATVHIPTKTVDASSVGPKPHIPTVYSQADHPNSNFHLFKPSVRVISTDIDETQNILAEIQQHDETPRRLSFVLKPAPRLSTRATVHIPTKTVDASSVGPKSHIPTVYSQADHPNSNFHLFKPSVRVISTDIDETQNILAEIQQHDETPRRLSFVLKPAPRLSTRATVHIPTKTVDASSVGPKSHIPTVYSQADHPNSNFHLFKPSVRVISTDIDETQNITKYGVGSLIFKQEQTIPFKSYMPSYETRDFFNNNFKKCTAYNERAVRLLRLNNELKSSSNPLTEQNYLDALVLFPDIEDLYCEVAIRVYNRKFVKIEKSNKTKYYIMHIPNLKDSRPSISKNGRLTIDSFPIEKRKIFGTISNIEQDHIMVEFNGAIDTSILYNVEFLSNRTTFRMEKLVAQLMKEKNLVSFMFPKQIEAQNSSHIVDQQFTWFNKSVAENSEQQTAITNIYRGTSYPHPYILFGPPGTGKTTTLVESVLQLWKNKSETRILIVATSNFACNVISKRLLGFLPKTEMFRLFSKSQEMVINKIDDVILDASNLKSKNHYNPRPAELYPYRLIIATATAVGRLISQGFACDHFTHLFVDECGSCTEGSTLISIAGLISSRNTINANIILAGDPLQLRPVILSKYAEDLGYSISMLERLMKLPLYQKDDKTGDYNTKFITKLLLNYRSHKDILHTSNQLFYKNELKALGSKRITDWLIDWTYLPNPKCPVIFEAVFGKSLSENGSPSLYNQHEINAVMLYLQQLVNTNINGKVVRQSDIGVITPYQKQNQKIRNQLGGKWNKVEVATVEAFQGNEKSVIILSTVRSNVETMGFLSNERRLNVALTRAQSLMIIIGDPTVLMMDKCWYQLLKFCYDNNAICGKPFDFYK